jgi:hypothetical protein
MEEKDEIFKEKIKFKDSKIGLILDEGTGERIDEQKRE